MVVTATNSSCVLHNHNQMARSSFDVLKFLGCNGDHNQALDTARGWLGLPDFDKAKLKSAVVVDLAEPIISQPVECPKTALETIVASVRQKMALDTKLDTVQTIILESIIDCADNLASAELAINGLVIACETNKSKVIRSIQRLIDRGYIRKYIQANNIGGNSTNVYQLLESEPLENKSEPLVDSGLMAVSSNNELLGIDENGDKLASFEPENDSLQDRMNPYFNIQKKQSKGNSINTDFECNEKSDLNRVATKKADDRKGDTCQLAHPLTLPTENVEQFCYDIILGLVAKQKTNKLVWASDKTKVSKITKQRVIMALAEYFDLATIEQAYLQARKDTNEIEQAYKYLCSLDIDTLRIEIDAKRLTNASMNMKRKDSRLHHALVRMAEKIYSSKLRKQSR